MEIPTCTLAIAGYPDGKFTKMLFVPPATTLPDSNAAAIVPLGITALPSSACEGGTPSTGWGGGFELVSSGKPVLAPPPMHPEKLIETPRRMSHANTEKRIIRYFLFFGKNNAVGADMG
jgi:hypothetical protein